jgi:F0F1-type ATP synthase assembly protein I
VIATLSDIAETAPWAFVGGLAVGFVIGARYRIEKRNGREDRDGQ